jgi:predicted dithiol-disulfide oxidoreductase (DUF899 family)
VMVLEDIALFLSNVMVNRKSSLLFHQCFSPCRRCARLGDATSARINCFNVAIDCLARSRLAMIKAYHNHLHRSEMPIHSENVPG